MEKIELNNKEMIKNSDLIQEMVEIEKRVRELSNHLNFLQRKTKQYDQLIEKSNLKVKVNF